VHDILAVLSAVFVLGAAVAGGACVPIDGGAVEASWVVRSREGAAITDCACSDPEIASVRFALVGARGEVMGQTPCTGRTNCAFSCQRHTGATPFDIPPGFYLMSLIPVDAAGQDLTVPDPARGQASTPAPVLREVVRGQPTELDAFALVAGCSQRCGANNSNVCSGP
jgi:hypothetical protein